LAVGTEVDYIPGGYTCKLQMLDVGVNKPFKNNVTFEFNNWLVGSDTLKPSRQDVSQWIDAAWKKVTVNSIKNSWRKVGIEHMETTNDIIEAEPMDDDEESNDDPIRGGEDVQWDTDTEI
jgi:hypothetical protein